ncbi:MAG: AbrB/MazE/SpoVT family DNA-binding domain-containing protein [Planctomycetota bacterium]
MTRAKLFRNGGSQAVRLPKDCRFEGDEVLVHRRGKSVVLEPANEWPEEFLAVLGAWSEEIERPRSGKVTGVRDPFARR